MYNHIQNMSIICGFAKHIEHLFKQFANTIKSNNATLLKPTKTNNIKESEHVCTPELSILNVYDIFIKPQSHHSLVLTHTKHFIELRGLLSIPK